MLVMTTSLIYYRRRGPSIEIPSDRRGDHNPARCNHVSTYIASALPALVAVEMKYSRENVDAAKASLAPGATPTAVTDARLSTGAFVFMWMTL